MRKSFCNMKKGMIAAAVFVLGLSAGFGPAAGMSASAAENGGYYDESGNWVEEQITAIDGTAPDAQGQDVEIVQDPAAVPADAMENPEASDVQAEQSQRTGTYTVGEGWSVDDAASTADKTVYKQDAYVGTEGTSTISCSYMDTNYSVLEYEQLRDMLTNNLLYSNVNAQLSTSAVYTDAKDYLYILIVDDTSQDYRDIYHYVVGDYRCFSVEVREYRAEAEQLKSQEQKTPQEAAESAATGFVWN